MGSLEQLLRGTAVGATETFDLFGSALSYWDRWTVGASPADPERAPATITNLVKQRLYSDYKDVLPFWGTHVPRFIGQSIGNIGAMAALGTAGYLAHGAILPYLPTTVLAGAATAGSYLGLSAASAGVIAASVAGALVVPALLGIYGAGAMIYKYARDFVRGEDDGKPKASFYDGFRYGWHTNTHIETMLGFLDLEDYTTGRGPADSHTRLSIRDAAQGMRRNFAAVAGSVAGGIVGGIASVLSLGIVPLYKSIRDGIRSIRHARHAYA